MAINRSKRQAAKPDNPVIPWLLDSGSDSSIRWQVMQDLLGAPVEEVAAERARVRAASRG